MLKKRIVLVVSTLLGLSLIIFSIKKIIINIRWIQFEKDVVNFYNGKSFKIDNNTFSEYAYVWLDYAKKEAPHEYKIDDVIKDYLDSIQKSIEYKLNGKKQNFTRYYKPSGLDIVGIHGIDDNHIRHIAKLITDEDITDYNNNTFNVKLAKKLETIFLHKSDNFLKDWYIINDKDKRVELPYNVYYDFKYNGKKLNNQINYIKSIKIGKSRPCVCDIKYLDNDGKVVDIQENMVTFENKEKKIRYVLPSLENLFYQNDNMPEITAGQHDADIAEDLGNLSSARTSTWSYSTDPEFAYPDDSTEELREEEYYQSPILTLYEGDDMRWGWLWLLKYKTGEIKYATSLYKMYKIKTFDYNYKDKITYLPYEGIETIEELKERYLNDKERYEADKKWLYEPVELSEEEKKEAAEDKYKWNQ